MRMHVRILIALILMLVIAACGPAVPDPATPASLPTSAIEEAADDVDADAAEAADVVDAETEADADVAEVSDEEAVVADAVESDTEAVATEETESDAVAEFPENRPDIRALAGTQETYGDNNIEVGFTEDGHPYIGSLDKAPVIIEEYSDFQCPYCGRFYSQTLDSLLSAEIANGDAALVFYDFPLNFHAQAAAAANAARCAGEQSATAYWQMHDEIFNTLGQWSVADPSPQFISYAEAIETDLNMEEFSTCVAENRYADAVQADLSAGQQRGIRGTPGFFVNGELLSGAQPYGTFQGAIARAAAGEGVVQAEPAQVDPSTIEVPEPEPFALSDNFAGALGDPNAPVVVVEFTDYQCPFCGRHSAQTMPQLMSEYIDQGRIYYIMKDLPLDQIHPRARDAAAAARCAGQQELYWEMHDLLFETQDAWGQGDMTEAMRSYASDLSLDMAAFDTCYADQGVRDAIEANVQEAQTIGISGTPFFFVDGFPVINGAQPIEAFAQVIGLAEDGALVDAIKDAQRRQLAAQQQEAQQQEAQAQAAPTGPVDVPIDGAFAIGNPDAPVVVVEYTDYQCPFCARHHSQTFEQIVSQYVDEGLVYYVFKDFPLNFHPQAEPAAVAARCAGAQDAFLDMHSTLFNVQSEWNGRADAAELFAGYAADLGLDMDAFTACQADTSVAQLVRDDFAEGSGFGVRGTPAFFINGQLISGAQSFDTFQQIFNGEIGQ